MACSKRIPEVLKLGWCLIGIDPPPLVEAVTRNTNIPYLTAPLNRNTSSKQHSHSSANATDLSNNTAPTVILRRLHNTKGHKICPAP